MNTYTTNERTYTFSEWQRMTKKAEAKARAEKIYYMKQKGCGIILLIIAFIPVDICYSLICLLLGIFLIITRKKVMCF